MTKQSVNIAALTLLSLASCMSARAEPILTRAAREFAERVGHHGLMEIIKCWRAPRSCSGEVTPGDVQTFRSLTQSEREAVEKAFGTTSGDTVPKFDPKRSLTGPAR